MNMCSSRESSADLSILDEILLVPILLETKQEIRMVSTKKKSDRSVEKTGKRTSAKDRFSPIGRKGTRER